MAKQDSIPQEEICFYLAEDRTDPVLLKVSRKVGDTAPRELHQPFGQSRKGYACQRALCIALLLAKCRFENSPIHGDVLIEATSSTKTWVSLLAQTFDSAGRTIYWFDALKAHLGGRQFIRTNRNKKSIRNDPGKKEKRHQEKPEVFYRAVDLYPLKQLKFFVQTQGTAKELLGNSLLEFARVLESGYWENTTLTGPPERVSKLHPKAKSSPEENIKKMDSVEPSLAAALPELLHVTLPSAASTNTVSRQMIAEGHPLPFLVHAWNQTHGKGKLGRVWQGGTGVLTATWNYAFSKEDSTPEILGLLGTVTALAVRDAICTLNRALNPVQVKWPNDILIAGKKAAGILIELTNYANSRIASIGIGVNVCRTPILTDRNEYALPPASVFDDYNDDASREVWIENGLSTITESLEKRISQLLREGGLAGQKTEFEQNDYSFGKEVVILSSGSKPIARGVNRGINFHGQLVIEYRGGKRKEYHSGEVTTVRTATGPDVDEPELPPKSIPFPDNEGGTCVVITSPIVGTFYEAESFESPPLVAMGARVKVGQHVCIIEAGKQMELISSDCSGFVVEIFAKNGQPVRSGDPLIKIRLEGSATTKPSRRRSGKLKIRKRR